MSGNYSMDEVSQLKVLLLISNGLFCVVFTEVYIISVYLCFVTTCFFCSNSTYLHLLEEEPKWADPRGKTGAQGGGWAGSFKQGWQPCVLDAGLCKGGRWGGFEQHTGGATSD